MLIFNLTMPRRIIADNARPERKLVLWSSSKKGLEGGLFGKLQKIMDAKQLGTTWAYCQDFLHGEFPRDTAKFKPAKGGIYKLKPWKLRVFGFFEDSRKTFVIVHAAIKKTQKDGKKEAAHIDTAISRMEKARKDTKYIVFKNKE